ncbi:MAG: hypothetical protein HY907_01095 [Deltaproteobacteria bacterium]|nr:hypothetical protein [Deltaproteobacteria bacterium]
MGLFQRMFGKGSDEHLAALRRIREKFSLFRSLLDHQNRVLKDIGQLEVRSRRNLPIEAADVVAVEEAVAGLVEQMVELGGDSYAVLRERLSEVRREIRADAAGTRRVAPDEFVIPYDRLGRERAPSVGNKNANLGELRSRLGLPVPDGFAVSAWGFHRFLEANALREKIDALLREAGPAGPGERDAAAGRVRSLVVASPVPDDLRAAITDAFEKLSARCRDHRFAVRSSAIDEDGALSFAGQFVTLLNVGRDNLLESYKHVLASTFTPASVHFARGRGAEQFESPMGVGCLALVDAAASGVLYTRDPLDPDAPRMLVNAIRGLGAYLVDGVLTPDVFHVSRDDRSVALVRVAKKTVQLVPQPGGGVAEAPVPQADQERPAASDDQLRMLAGFALRVEEHYGVPQDIEWAIDHDGRLFLLQARPLRLVRRRTPAPAPPELHGRALAGGGTCICPGAGAGPVFHVRSPGDIHLVPDGAVVVAENPSPRLIAIMHRAAALVTRVGGAASHMATLAREAGIPTVAGIERAGELPDGMEITVDATAGTLYEGPQRELVDARRRETEPQADDAGAAPSPLRRTVERIAHLNLISPGDPEFRAERCRTLHDITRFIHQRAMEEMFGTARATAHKDRIGLRLKTDIPLAVDVIRLDEEHAGAARRGKVAEAELDSVPMQALWSGIKEEGWPSRPVPADLKGFLAVMGTNITEGNQPQFSESSYAFVSREYMLFNIRMGYHYATIEALLTAEPSANYVRMQFKEGGAPLERRVRRIRLICDLLRRMGFETSSQADFMDATLAYQDADTLAHRLRLLGRVNIMTKQLDMALSNDSVTQWYTDDFSRRLGLESAPAGRTGARPGGDVPIAKLPPEREGGAS